MRHLLDKACIVLRLQDVLDENNVVRGKDWLPVSGPYPCRLSAKQLVAAPGEVATMLTNVYTLYLDDPAADIQAGDLIEIDGVRYRCAEPYRPGGHHIEVTVTYEGAA